MTNREMLVAFEDLIRNTNPELAIDVEINTDIIYYFLTMSEKKYIEEYFLSGDDIENINEIRKRSDVLRNLIVRGTASVDATAKSDGGYEVTINEDNGDYWMYLYGTMKHTSLSTNDKGSDQQVLNLVLHNHYDINNKIRTLSNEPLLKYIPIILEGDNKFIMYLSKEYKQLIGSSLNSCEFGIVYLKYPVGISISNQPSLHVSTHSDIVKIAVDMFIMDYKYKLRVKQSE